MPILSAVLSDVEAAYVWRGLVLCLLAGRCSLAKWAGSYCRKFVRAVASALLASRGATGALLGHLPRLAAGAYRLEVRKCMLMVDPACPWRGPSACAGKKCASIGATSFVEVAQTGSCTRNRVQAAAAISVPDRMEAQVVSDALKKLLLNISAEEEMTYMSHHVLDGVRQQIIATAFPEVATGKPVLLLASSGAEIREYIVLPKGCRLAEFQLLFGKCQISDEVLTPSECIEFGFAGNPEVWYMTQLSEEALDMYRSMKFDAWKSALLNPTCEAQLRRMLQIGMISQVYDAQVFPTPKTQKARFQVMDERTGKFIALPNPVSALRVWDADKQAYKYIDARLMGAPGQAQAEQWWAEFMQELKSKHGAEYIAGLMATT